MRLSGSSVVDGSWKTACWLGHVTTSSTVLIIPKPIEFGEGELSVEVLDVVPNVEDETSLIAAVLYAAQASADHLKVESGDVCGHIRLLWGSDQLEAGDLGEVAVMGGQWALQ